MITWLLNYFAPIKPPQPTQLRTGQHHVSRAFAHPIQTKTIASETNGMLKTPMCRPTTPSAISRTKPLRIIQWVESASSTHPCNRRMVMSGRLADICAELDRLVAMESA